MQVKAVGLLGQPVQSVAARREGKFVHRDIVLAIITRIPVIFIGRRKARFLCFRDSHERESTRYVS